MEEGNDLQHMVDLDENVDSLLDIFEEMRADVEKIQPMSVPQRAAKDRMVEIIEGAFQAYLAEFIQCNHVFEQGTE